MGNLTKNDSEDANVKGQTSLIYGLIFQIIHFIKHLLSAELVLLGAMHKNERIRNFSLTVLK